MTGLNTNLNKEGEMLFDSEKIYLGRWSLDSCGYTVGKGNRNVNTPPSSLCKVETTDIMFDSLSIGNLKVYACDDFYNGQDIRALAQFSGDIPKNIPQMVMHFICDGHGDFVKGKNIAIEVPKIISENLVPYCKNTLRKFYQTKCINDEGKEQINKQINKEIKENIEKLFSYCDDEILKRYSKGGTTCTIKWFILDPISQNLHVYDIILGDSPSMSIDVDKEKVEEIGFCQNCDTKEGIEQWLNISYNEPDAKPPKVVLGRFNTRPNGYLINSVDWVKDVEGYKMINIYDITQNDDLSWKLEKSDTLKRFYTECPHELKKKFSEGGPQTLRDKPKFKEEYLSGEYPSFNFGNTIEGFGQNLGTFGDKVDKVKFKTHCVPNINYSYISETPKEVYLIGSDGTLDVNTDENIVKAFKVAKNMNKDGLELADNYCKELVYQGNKQAICNRWKFKDGLGVWDDQSAWVIVLNGGHKLSNKTIYTKNKNKKINKADMGRRQRSNYKHKKKRDARKRRRRFKKKLF